MQIQGSYTKRINRPRDFTLDPLKVHTNPLSYQSGNPNLLPELINSFELSIQKKINEASFLSVEGFYRKTNNPMESISKVDKSIKDTAYSTTANYDYDRSTGVEIMLNLALAKWFNFNASSSIYQDHLFAGENTLLNNYSVANISENIDTWNIKINPSFRLSTGTSAQINYQYNAPSNAPQGTRKGNYSNSIGIRQDMFKHKGSLTLQIRDFIPGSDKYATTSQYGPISAPLEYSYNYYKREQWVVMLTLSYRINNYKAQQAKRPEEINNNNMEDMNGMQ